MGQYPVLSRGPTPPLFQTLVAAALFQTFVARHYYMMDLVAPALSQKPIFVTNFVAREAPRLCYKAELLMTLQITAREPPGRVVHQSPALAVQTSEHPISSGLTRGSESLGFRV